VRRSFKDPTTFARVNGNPALGLEVVKRTGENIIETIAAVQAIIEQERPYWPQGLTVGYSNDKSEDIRTMLTDLQNNVLSAILLVMIVVVGALGVRGGLLVGLAIPGSFLAGVMALSIMGLTVNVVVLFALILAVGMLVDGAIVVTEYADRKLTEGVPKQTAYGMAAKRMAWPIISSTATTLAAFLPLLFWPGVVGEFMKFLPITLIATLTASLAMALIFVPVLGANLAVVVRVVMVGALAVAGFGV
ncbi:MAG TPA: MFS transporter, partial [Rhodospirillaceae bacterium]|nr:MFS transporter [Rhodospirillaceae bacterium]